MGDRTGIAYCDATWNPVVGCRAVSAGCVHCYAQAVAHRFKSQVPAYDGLTDDRGYWSGLVAYPPERMNDPRKWKKPRRIFVCSMSDLFYDQISNTKRDEIFDVMDANQRHSYLLLTKRPDAMARYLTARYIYGRVPSYIWPGTTVENQQVVNRICAIRDLQSNRRWISYEPAIGPIDWMPYRAGYHLPGSRPAFDWLVIGGESGPDARGFDEAWATAAITFGDRNNIPVFMKQMGSRPNFMCYHESNRGEEIGIVQRDRHGANPDEWMPRLHVRQWPDTYEWPT